MRILITGANGLLGQKLVALLRTDTDVSFVATARENSIVDVAPGTFRQLDITNRETVMKVISETKPDVIVNTAAMTQVDACEDDRETCWQANVNAVSYLIEACRDNRAHLIHVSTDFIFDGTKELLDESAEPNPVNYYGKSKLAGEQKLIDSDISWCIVRTVLVYGVTQGITRSNIVLWVKNNLEQKKTIRVVNDQWRTPTLAEDLAAGCLLAAKKRATGIFNISGKDYMSVHEIAVRTATFFNLDKSNIVETDSTHFKQPAARPMKTGFIIAKARKELGYEPRSFEEGLALVARQLRSH